MSQLESYPKRCALAGALAVAAVQLLSVFQPGVVEVDGEEMVNAGQALALLDGHWSALFRLQYRGFCGGCSINSVLGAGVFSILPPSWLAWKIVPTSLVALFAFVGFLLIDRRVGRVGAWAFVALVLFAPRAWQRLSLIAFGHHFEPGIFAFLGLATLAWREGPPSVRRALAGGALLGLAVFAGPPGAFALLAATGWLLWPTLSSPEARGSRSHQLVALRTCGALLVGASLALLLWGLQVGMGGVSPFGTVHYAGEAFPNVLRVPAKLWTVFEPRQLVALFGAPHSPWGWIAGWAAAVSFLGGAVWTIRRGQPLSKMLAWFATSWLIVYALVRFSLAAPSWPEIATHGGVRYAAPVYPFLLALVAAIFGQLWREERRRLACLLLAPPLLAGMLARGETFLTPFPATAVLQFEPVDYAFFRNKFAYALTPEEHAHTSDSPRMAALHAYARGRALVEEGRVPPASSAVATLEGFGDAWRDRRGLARDFDSALEGLDLDQQRAARRAFVEGEHEPTLNRDDYVEALAWRDGRAWGVSVAGFFDPQARPVDEGLSDLSPVERAGWIEGFGTGLGEEWGPQDRVPQPAGLLPSDAADFAAGYALGVARRWRSAQAVPVEWSSSE